MVFQALFQSTRPLRGATARAWLQSGGDFISIHAPLAGCDLWFGIEIGRRLCISIHAPLAGCDLPAAVLQPSLFHFNPRTPCGVRLFGAPLRRGSHSFQSTHPLRGATAAGKRAGELRRDFNPRTPCGVRQHGAGVARPVCAISIHAPLAGCDMQGAFAMQKYIKFQSPHPLRGATSSFLIQSTKPVKFQSTHPLRGATPCFLAPTSPAQHFNPRTPCGVRRATGRQDPDAAQFQSTHPLRGATDFGKFVETMRDISIHAPLAGCDAIPPRRKPGAVDFNPRTPCGVRRKRRPATTCAPAFQSTHPLRGATTRRQTGTAKRTISIHAPLAGCDTRASAQQHAHYIFQSTHPLRGATRHRRAALFTVQNFNPRTPCGVRQQKRTKNAALLRKRYKYKFFVCKKCTSGDLTGAYSSKNTLYSGANCSENPCALSVRTHRISGPSTSNPGLMPKCSILERYFSPR